MAILNFPDSPQLNDQYTGDNGTTYTYDGVKWVGFAAGGAAGTNSLQNGSYTVQVDADGNLVLPVGAVIKDAAGDPVGGTGTGNFGFSGNVAYNSDSPDSGLYVSPGGEGASYLYVPGNSESVSTLLQLANTSAGGVNILSGNSNWTFRTDGTLRNSNSFTKTSMSNITTTAPTVVWSASEDFISGVKLTIQVEANEVGDSTGWHSQVCEAIVASRGYASTYSGPGGDPVITVYAVTYTSVAPLVEFTVQRNLTTNLIEVVGTVTVAATSASLRIYSVETATRD